MVEEHPGRLSPNQVTQIHLILDDWVGLIGVVASSWVTGSTRPTDPHLLRLIAYLVLANRRALGVVGDQAGERHHPSSIH